MRGNKAGVDGLAREDTELPVNILSGKSTYTHSALTFKTLKASCELHELCFLKLRDLGLDEFP